MRCQPRFLIVCCSSACSTKLASDDPVPLLEPRQSLIAPCLGLGAHEAIAGYTEDVNNAKKVTFLL